MVSSTTRVTPVDGSAIAPRVSSCATFTTETGNPNTYVHICAYENAGDREKKRTAMQADPDWIAYTQKSAELGALVEQSNMLMRPVDFFPVKR